MAVFQVVVKARGIHVTFDGVEMPCGFFKNEYVWASTSDQAIKKALVNVESSLRKQAQVRKNEIEGLNLEIEEVQSGFGLLSLLSRQGFVFHPLEPESKIN